MAIDRFFLPVGGTGGGPVDQSFDTNLWHEIIMHVKKQEGPVKVGLLTTPSRLSGVIDVGALVKNHKKIEKELGCVFLLLNDKDFGSEKYDGQFDILCVTCGNTQGARDEWKKNGCEDVLRQWYERGVLVTGYSAGFILFYEWASTDSVAGFDGAKFGIMPCMGIIKGGAIPHIDTQKDRVPNFQKALSENEIVPVIALGEDVLAIYKNEQFLSIKSSKPNAMAGWVEKNCVNEIEIERI